MSDTEIESYYNFNGDACEEKDAYAKVITRKDGDNSQFILFNKSEMCHPQNNKKKLSSQFKLVNVQCFLYYMNYLINKVERNYELAKKKQYQ